MSLPWLMTALPREHGQFRPLKVSVLRRVPAAWRCRGDDREFLLAETGMGGVQVTQTLEELSQSGLPRYVFLAGFAGALHAELRVGAPILADAVVGPDGAAHPATLPLSLPYAHGTLLTSDRLIGSPADKRRLAETTGAVAVDMETSYVAAWCERRGVPWGCLRVVTDAAATPVSKDVFDLLENGHVSPWRLTKALIRRPAIVSELLTLGRATTAAAKVIAEALTMAIEEGPIV